ncbi:MAG: hypothetical protein M3315_15485 [Actinomycetota bacterium]|nr:hypothetical protein [Actinomycetota bacterium]MDQ3921402.1 hypothetical protein [Actinomycetota bacterium]
MHRLVVAMLVPEGRSVYGVLIEQVGRTEDAAALFGELGEVFPCKLPVE